MLTRLLMRVQFTTKQLQRNLHHFYEDERYDDLKKEIWFALVECIK